MKPASSRDKKAYKAVRRVLTRRDDATNRTLTTSPATRGACALWALRLSALLLQDGIEHLYDEALLSLGQCADAFELLLQLGCRPALARAALGRGDEVFDDETRTPIIRRQGRRPGHPLFAPKPVRPQAREDRDTGRPGHPLFAMPPPRAGLVRYGRKLGKTRKTRTPTESKKTEISDEKRMPKLVEIAATKMED